MKGESEITYIPFFTTRRPESKSDLGLLCFVNTGFCRKFSNEEKKTENCFE